MRTAVKLVTLMSGGAAFSPLDLSPALWLTADAGVFSDDAATTPAAADGDVIAVWQDQSGNDYHVVQTDNTMRPLLKLAANGINGRATILFDGSDDQLARVVANWLAGIVAGSIFAVYRLTAAPSDLQPIIASNDVATPDHIITFRAWRSAANPYTSFVSREFGFNANVLSGDTVLAVNTTYIVAHQSNDLAISLRVNGVAQTVTAVTGSNDGLWFGGVTLRDSLQIGASTLSSGTAYLKGSISEVLVYNTFLTGADLANVEKYLNTRYGAY